MGKICRILENLRKTFFYRKKIQLQLSKSGVFVIQKCSLIFFFFFRTELQVKKMCRILEKKCGKKSKRKKIQLQVSKSGVFWEKKCSANFLKLRS